MKFRQAGLAMVEFAISMPLIVMLMLASVEIVRAFTQYNRLAHSARDALIYVSRNASPGQTGNVAVPDSLRDAGRNLVVYGNTTGTGPPVLPGLTVGQINFGVTSLTDVTITVTYPYQSVLGGRIPTFGYGTSPDPIVTLSIFNQTRAL